MSTLLNRTSLPYWVFIIIILVGSACILVIVAFIIRCLVMRRRNATPTESDEFTAPMRRVTVRRGRVVPQSHYLSLTGSKFGLNEIDADASTTRSKSPFEWWNKVNKKQGQEEMSQSGSIYGKKELAQSANSLAQTTPEKQARSVTREVVAPVPSPTALPSPLPSPGLPWPSPTASPARSHFSRPFHSATPGSPFMSNGRLSKIEEAHSPRNSMYSINSRQRSSKMSLSPHEANLTRHEPDGSRRGSSQRSYAGSEPLANSSSQSLPFRLPIQYPPYQQNFQNRPMQQRPAPMPLEYPGSRTSLGEIEQPRPSLSHHSSSSSRRDSVRDYEPGRSPKTSLPPVAEQPPPQQTQSQVPRPQQYSRPAYQQFQRPDGHLKRTTSSSKKGKVLRKKSLRKMDMINQFS